MECKLKNSIGFPVAADELIDTLWNVNDDVFVFFVSWFNELIDTLWNVNKEYLQKIRYIAEN